MLFVCLGLLVKCRIVCWKTILHLSYHARFRTNEDDSDYLRFPGVVLRDFQKEKTAFLRMKDFMVVELLFMGAVGLLESMVLRISRLICC